MKGEHEIRVRGRDFTGYRIGGAIAALVFAVALAWQGFYLLQGYNVVVPEIGWAATGEAGRAQGAGAAGAEAPSGALASEVLTARTRLMDERLRTGPAPGEPAPPLATGAEERLVTGPLSAEGTTYPRAWAAADEATLSLLRGQSEITGQTMVPYPNAGVFERPEGRDWRHGINDWATHVGAVAILGTIVLLGLVLAIRGRVPIAIGRDGRTVERFAFVERATHWMTAGSFVALALTGIVISFGTTLVAPIWGERALGDLGWISTWGHMLFAPPFFLGICVMFVMWVLRNLPEPSLDLPWLARLGGMMSDDPDNPPAKKFNAGQKVTFWVAVLGGMAMTATGVTLMFPYFWLGLSGMVWVMLAHALIGLVMIAFFIGHAYIGTVGMQDAIHAMWGGRVDLNWAREHHELWLDELARKGKLPPDFHDPALLDPGVTPTYRAGRAGRVVVPGREREA